MASCYLVYSQLRNVDTGLWGWSSWRVLLEERRQLTCSKNRQVNFLCCFVIVVSDGQVMFAARILAQLQFCARDPRRMEWWMKKEQTICLEELYTCFIPTYYPMLIENKPGNQPINRFRLNEPQNSLHSFVNFNPCQIDPLAFMPWETCLDNIVKLWKLSK